MSNDYLTKRMSGESRFITDILPTELIFGITVRAAIANGEVLSIKLPELPAGYLVAGYKDIPGNKHVNIFGKELPLLTEKRISYLGEPLLLLGGPSKSRLKELVSRIKIQYREELPALSSAAVTMNSLEDHTRYSSGDVHTAFANANQIVEGDYTTALQISYNIEPQCAIAITDKHQVLVYTSSNHPFSVRDNIAAILGLPRKKVRVIVPETCAPLGGKIIVPTLVAAHTALLSFLTGKTVKIEYSQAEDISFGVKKYPFTIQCRSALSKEGALTAGTIAMQVECGSSSIFSRYISHKIIATASHYYKCPNLELDITFNITNKAPVGGFNGIGETEICYAMELQANKITKFLKTDPLSWKMNNLPPGDNQPAGTGPAAVLERVVQSSDFKRKHGAYAALNRTQPPMLSGPGRPMRGIGLSYCPHHITTGIESRNPVYSVETVLGQDRILRIKTSAVDMGDSKSMLFSSLASALLETHIAGVVIEQVDTFQVPDSGATIGSKAVSILSRLVEQCCHSLLQRMKKETLPLTVRKRYAARGNKIHPETTWEAAVVEVEITPVTFEIQCRGIWIVIDAGKIINPDIARNHIELAALQNYEYAHLDENDYEHFSNYTVTSALDVPPVYIDFIGQDGKSASPRSLGDQPVCGVAPAYINAVSQACAREITALPVTPETIQNLQEKNENRV